MVYFPISKGTRIKLLNGQETYLLVLHTKLSKSHLTRCNVYYGDTIGSFGYLKVRYYCDNYIFYEGSFHCLIEQFLSNFKALKFLEQCNNSGVVVIGFVETTQRSDGAGFRVVKFETKEKAIAELNNYIYILQNKICSFLTGDKYKEEHVDKDGETEKISLSEVTFKPDRTFEEKHKLEAIEIFKRYVKAFKELEADDMLKEIREIIENMEDTQD